MVLSGGSTFRIQWETNVQGKIEGSPTLNDDSTVLYVGVAGEKGSSTGGIYAVGASVNWGQDDAEDGGKVLAYAAVVREI